MSYFTITYSLFTTLVFWFMWIYKVLPEIAYDVFISGACALFFCIISYHCYPSAKRLFFPQRVSPHDKAVLITGCDTGFGHELAKKLDLNGYHVFAGCLFPDGEGANTLKKVCSSRLIVFGIDVTKENSILDALSFVKNNIKDIVLWAIVNNAGVLEGCDIGWGDMKSFEKCMTVNTIGPVRVTKAFLPLLIENQGRVVTVASIGGRLITPHAVPYTMSKFAAVSFSECLRLEVRRFGIKVISIEPSFFGTTMLTNAWQRIDNVFPGDEIMKEIYGEQYLKNVSKVFKVAGKILAGTLNNAINCLYDAVSLEEPQDIYSPNMNLGMNIIMVVLVAVPSVIWKIISTVVMYVMRYM